LSATQQLRLVGSVLRAFRGYGLALWLMVDLSTSPSRLGPNLVNLFVVVGAALIALSLLAPGFPAALSVAGVLAVLAGVTAAALRTCEWRRLAVRLVVALVLVSALAGIGMARGGVKDPGAPLVRLLAVIGIVVLGWWIGGVRSPGPPAGGPGVAR